MWTWLLDAHLWLLFGLVSAFMMVDLAQNSSQTFFCCPLKVVAPCPCLCAVWWATQCILSLRCHTHSGNDWWLQNLFVLCQWWGRHHQNVSATRVRARKIGMTVPTILVNMGDLPVFEACAHWKKMLCVWIWLWQPAISLHFFQLVCSARGVSHQPTFGLVAGGLWNCNKSTMTRNCSCMVTFTIHYDFFARRENLVQWDGRKILG